HGVRQVRRRRPTRSPVPDALSARLEDLVCVVGEANAWPYRVRRASRGRGQDERLGGERVPDEIIHWVAHRVATGETFDLIVAPGRPLSPSTAFHVELSEDEIRCGAPRHELGARFARFSRPTDLLCAWGHHGLDLAIASGIAPAERLDLRAVA